MSKRKLILLGILLLILLLAVLVSVLPKKQGGEDPSVGVDFITDFFGLNRDRTKNPQTGEDPSFVPEPNPSDQAKLVLQRVSSFPVAGFGVFMHEQFIKVPVVNETTEVGDPAINGFPSAPETEFVPILRYADRLTGNVFQTPAEDIDERKISTTIVPGVREALFTKNGESVILRYLKQDGETIATFVASLPKYILGGDIGVGEINGTFLPDNITSISLSPDKSKIFYVVEVGTGVAGVISNYLGGDRTQVFDSPYTEWLSEWANQQTISLTTKPSGIVLGYIYAVNPNNKKFSRILGGIRGLTGTISPNGSSLLYNNSELALNVLNRTGGYVDELRIRTIPEKCVWGKSNTILYCAVPKVVEIATYPDAWYQGEVSFSDQIWKIDLFGKTEVAILDPLDVVGEDMDAVSLALDENEEFLFFINKKDSYLWKLELE